MLDRGRMFFWPCLQLCCSCLVGKRVVLPLTTVLWNRPGQFSAVCSANPPIRPVFLVIRTLRFASSRTVDFGFGVVCILDFWRWRGLYFGVLWVCCVLALLPVVWLTGTCSGSSALIGVAMKTKNVQRRTQVPRSERRAYCSYLCRRNCVLAASCRA